VECGALSVQKLDIEIMVEHGSVFCTQHLIMKKYLYVNTLYDKDTGNRYTISVHTPDIEYMYIVQVN